MRKISLALAVSAACAMVASPVLAQSAAANTSAASKLSIQSLQIRKGAALSKKSNIRPTALFALLGGVAVIGGAIAIASNGKKKPASP